ncbi:RHS repeat-associated protein OS=Streptomyces albaduncus OX=68172 GN=FHS32_004335 PE=3 SV=1 [Streptomyces griseoloalbus]
MSRPDGLRWVYQYDTAGRLVAESDFDGRTQTYRHDAAGRVVERINALGQSVRMTRDVFGRMVGKDVDGAVSTIVIDLNDRLVGAEGPDASVTLLRIRKDAWPRRR